MKEIISIIIPTFNRAHLILDTLVSIQRQTYPYWECIIIDDGSVDDSKSLILGFLKDDRRFTYLQRPENRPKGASSCRNYGFELSKGSFVQFFDSDDIMHPNHLEEKIIAIKAADFVVCKLQEFQGNFDYDLFKTDNVPDILKFDDLFEAFVCGNFPMMMVAPMWQSVVLKRHLPFNENLHVLEDHELYSRILFEFKTYAIVNKTLIYYRQSQTSSMNQFYSNLQTGIDSYLLAKKTVLKLSQSKNIKLAILKMVLGIMRMGLAQKNYHNAEKCFAFIKTEKLAYNYSLQRKTFRVQAFYLLFKIIGRGNTKFKFLLKV
ncbi:glycosyltransferase family 2 protein [Flavobacterium sp. GB2R13]|uniref:glycosyltransferase family 2 protein n=1 Tax=Flavobacterium algoris TaxID=3398733 RepID=UPI003A884FB2